jgi:hypothetical protein
MAALVGILTGNDSNLQLDAAWCLTNIAAGLESHESTVLTNAGPYLVTYLSSGNAPLQVQSLFYLRSFVNLCAVMLFQDQCAWAIGNIAGGNSKHRDILQDQGAIQALINLLQVVIQLSMFCLMDNKCHELFSVVSSYQCCEVGCICSVKYCQGQRKIKVCLSQILCI